MYQLSDKGDISMDKAEFVRLENLMWEKSSICNACASGYIRFGTCTKEQYDNACEEYRIASRDYQLARKEMGLGYLPQ